MAISKIPETESDERALGSEEVFCDFADRLKLGDNQAAEELLRRYAVRLRSMASRRVGNRLRSKIDPEDVLQSVFGSFFAGLRDGKFEIASTRNLRGLLAMMVSRKCARYVGKFTAARRDLQRELSDARTYDAYTALQELPDREPWPDDVIALADALEHWLDQFDSQDRLVVESFLNGETTSEIAERFRCSQRTVQRTIRRACQRLGLE